MSPSQHDTAFLEIEHKFLVGDGFALDTFLNACRQLNPEREKALQVTDTYYLPGEGAKHIYRHRIDAEIQQLTIKSRGGDNEVRTEINLNLGPVPSQEAEVRAWMRAVGAGEGQSIVKDIHVFDFPDCEIVYYEARRGDRCVCCVEFEAKYAATESAGLEILEQYEAALGFDAQPREKTNLYDLLIGSTQP